MYKASARGILVSHCSIVGGPFMVRIFCLALTVHFCIALHLCFYVLLRVSAINAFSDSHFRKGVLVTAHGSLFVCTFWTS